MTSTAAMEAGSTSVERLLAAAVATMEKARYCWAMTVAEDGSVNARPMGPQKSPASEDPFGILFLTRRGSTRASHARAPCSVLKSSRLRAEIDRQDRCP
jgi:hypothetical protein